MLDRSNYQLSTSAQLLDVYEITFSNGKMIGDTSFNTVDGHKIYVEGVRMDRKTSYSFGNQNVSYSFYLGVRSNKVENRPPQVRGAISETIAFPITFRASFGGPAVEPF